jgi:hypothetical protein
VCVNVDLIEYTLFTHWPQNARTMGCKQSTAAEAKEPRARAPSQAEPKAQPPPQRTEHVPVPAPAPVPVPTTPVPAPASLPTAVASTPKARTGGNAAIYATSTDRRTQEVEFFRTIVKRTEEYEGCAVHAHCYATAQILACVHVRHFSWGRGLITHGLIAHRALPLQRIHRRDSIRSRLFGERGGWGQRSAGREPARRRCGECLLHDSA